MRSSIGLALAVALGVAGGLPAQEFVWTEGGVRRSARVATEVPEDAWPGCRFHGEVERVIDGSRLVVDGFGTVALLGVDPPDALGADGEAAVRAAREALETALPRGCAVTLGFSGPAGARAAGGVIVRREGAAAGTRSVNAELLAAGVARCSAPVGDAGTVAALRAAQAEAREEGRGLWAVASPVPAADARPYRGFSLGLYAQDPDFDYAPFLLEMSELGCTDVMLITPWFVDDWQGHGIAPREGRSTPLDRVARTARRARTLGMRVALMPILLLVDAPKDRWRGNLEPRDVDAWFRAYGRFVGRFADLGRAAGCDLLVVGSELSSMERHEAAWRGVIADARARFPGRLSYSANWDHLSTIRWWDALDLVGMNGYHGLSDRDDPGVAELEASWRRIRDRLRREHLDRIGLPYLFTEVGYASLDGINRKPWDYVSPERVDLGEQADCYQAFLGVWGKEEEPYRGTFFYTWWRNGDETDRRQYTVKGKPAEGVLRRWLKQP